MINKKQNTITQTCMNAKVGLAVVSIVTMSMASSTFAWSNDMTIAANVANFVSSPSVTPTASLSLKEKIQKFWNILLWGGDLNEHPIKEESEARQANLVHSRRQKQFFNDISSSKYVNDINALAATHIVKGYENKFHPQNHVRLGDFIHVLARAYIQKTAGNPNLVDAKTLRDTASSNKRLLGLETAQKDQILSSDDTQIILKNFITQHSDIVASELVFPADGTTVTKEQMAHMIVTLLDISAEEQTQGDYFTDISKDPAQAAINTLASFDIVENDSKFYPQNYVRRHDFVMMVTKAFATAEGKDILFGTSDIADIPAVDAIQSIYARAQKNGVLDYIIINTKGENSIDPDAFITKDEIYQTLKNVANVKLIIDTASQDDQMTRGELAALLVEVFDLDPQDDSSDTTDKKTLTQTVRVPLTKLVVSKL